MEKKEENPLAVVVVKKRHYHPLVDKLAQQFAKEGCVVEVETKLTLAPAEYVIYLGHPSEKERKDLQTAAKKFIVVLAAGAVKDTQKQSLKDIPIYFLPQNYQEDLEQIAAGIVTALFNHRFSRKKRTVQSAKPVRSKTSHFTPPASHHEGIVEHVPHINPRIIKAALLPLLVIFILILPLLYPYSLYRSARTHLTATLNALQEGDFARAETESAKTQESLADLSRVYGFAGPLLAKTLPHEDKTIRRLFATAEHALAIVNTTAEAGARAKIFVNKLLTQQAVSVEAESAYLTQIARLLKGQLAELNADLDALAEDNSRTEQALANYFANYGEKLAKTEEIITDVEPILPLLPEIMAQNGRRKYLLLLQNNMELRPTGGFIGSVGFLRFENGKMLPITIEDVYSLDGQLEGHVAPPAPIKQYLQQPDWYLRDANWNPDFPQAAEQIAWFLDKEIETEVDGIIAVDLEFAKRVLAAVNGVYLTDFNSHITADNLYLQTQTYSEKNFFPGATNKRDFLGGLARALLIDLAERDSLPVGRLLQGVYSSLAEKHLLLHFNNTEVQATLDNMGWTGRLLQPPCDTGAACLPDYLMVVEANLGVNKVNYFVNRAIKFNVKFAEGRLQRELVIDFTNESSSDSFPGGTYKNYLRLLVPPDAALGSLKINGQTQDITTLDREQVGPYQSIGFFVEVAPATTKTVKVTYSSPASFDRTSVYELLVQKQPGTINPAYVLSVDKQPGTTLEALNFQPVANKTSLIYNTTLGTDKIFRVKID